MEHIGIIYGTTDTKTFRFLATETAKKHGYIQVQYPKGNVLGVITEIEKKSNVGFEDAKKIYAGEKIILDNKISAVVEVIGYRDEKSRLQTLREPFSSGERVYIAEEDTIRQTLGLKNDGLYIGMLRYRNIPVFLDIKELTQKHVSILAKTGSGKSYLSGVFIEELIKHNVPVVVIDTHNEYSLLAHPNLEEKDMDAMERFNIRPKGYAHSIMVYTPEPEINKNALPLKFNITDLDQKDISDILNIKSPSGRGLLYRVLNELKTNRPYYSISDIKHALEDETLSSKVDIIGRLEIIETLNIFSEEGINFVSLVKEGQATIINLYGVSQDIQNIIVTVIGKQLFELRKLNKIPSFMFIIEEAHNFCPQTGSVWSSSILKKIASEGRKFGVGLCIVSQRPATVDKNVLSQCGTQIILKLTNPNDLKTIIASFEGLTSNAYDEIQRLPVGVSLIVGSGIITPVLVEVRVRETKYTGEELVPLTDEITDEVEIEGEQYIDMSETLSETKSARKKKGIFKKFINEILEKEDDST